MSAAAAIAPPRLHLRGAPLPGRVRLSVEGLRGHPEAEAVVIAAVGGLDGVWRAQPSAVTGTVLIEFDADRWPTQALLDAVEGALARSLAPEPAPDVAIRTAIPGRLRLSIPWLRRQPEAEQVLENRLRAIPGVELAQANAWTGTVLVLFDPEVCASDRLVQACAAQGPVAPGPTGRRPLPLPWSPAAARGPRGEPAPELATDWHAREATDVAAQLGVDVERGLSPGRVEQRRHEFGANRLPPPKEPSLWGLLAGQLLNAPTALLVVGAGISLATGGVLEAALIVGVLGSNAVIGAATERTGHRAISALRRSPPLEARVRRAGRELDVTADELVPGDIIHLATNDPVPADARVVQAERLLVEESALTGESQPVHKTSEAVRVGVALADRHSMLYRGTTVVGGRGRAIVVATGARTAIGALHVLASEAEAPPTPLERDLDRLGRWLAVGAGVVCTGVLGASLVRGAGLLPSLSVAVSLGVAAIPEGLTALATTVLALASGRMRRRETLIRTLGAAEALGSVTVVCADKTGTLTQNRMAARALDVGGQRFTITGDALSSQGTFERDGQAVDVSEDVLLTRALHVGVLCSDAELEVTLSGAVHVDGSATEGALQVAALKAGLDPVALRAQVPRLEARDRAEGRRHMLTVHRRGGELVALLKGSPDDVLGLCTAIANPAGIIALDEQTREMVATANAEMASIGLRVLALADRVLPDDYAPRELEGGYTFLGLIGLVDPIRPRVPAAIQALHGAGIRTLMITGDQPLTALAVARELGLARDRQLRVVDGTDPAFGDPARLRDLVREATVFARVAPEQKLAIVRAIQANGQVVAMTGDGVNDGPALRAADVGVAMGQHGTELARELADVVLSTDDFSRMVDAVEEGRLVRANVRRVLHYLLSTNASEVWVVTGAVAAGLPSPLTPLQLLWLNLVTDLAPGLGLAVEPRDPGLMHQPPRDPNAPILPRTLVRRLLLESAILAAGALGVYGVGIARHGRGPVAQTMAFASLLGAQLLHVPLARAGTLPATRGGRPANRVLTLGMAASAALQLVALFVPPIRGALGGAALGLTDLAAAALGAALPVGVIELERRAGTSRVGG